MIGGEFLAFGGIVGIVWWFFDRNYCGFHNGMPRGPTIKITRHAAGSF